MAGWTASCASLNIIPDFSLFLVGLWETILSNQSHFEPTYLLPSKDKQKPALAFKKVFSNISKSTEANTKSLAPSRACHYWLGDLSGTSKMDSPVVLWLRISPLTQDSNLGPVFSRHEIDKNNRAVLSSGYIWGHMSWAQSVAPQGGWV